MEDFPEFDAWRVEFAGEAGGSDEELLARAARWVFENEWSMVAPRPCARCGKDCQFRDADGNVIHPTCVDNPPNPFWRDDAPAAPPPSAEELQEIVTRARYGYRPIAPGQVCVICRQPCDCTDPAGLVRHAGCRL